MNEIDAEIGSILDQIGEGAVERAELVFLDHAAGAAWTDDTAKAAAFDALVGMAREITVKFEDGGLEREDPLIDAARARARTAFGRRFYEILARSLRGGTC